MKKNILLSIILTSALVVPLTIIIVRDSPFWRLPPFGDEYALTVYGGSGDRREHSLHLGFDRILRVSMRYDKEQEKDRYLEPDEWSYDRGKHLLVTKVRGLTPLPKSLPEGLPPYFMVEGVMGKPLAFYLEGFQDDVNDIFLYFYGERRAVAGQDFRYDSGSKILRVNRDADFDGVLCMYWNQDRHQFVIEETGNLPLDRPHAVWKSSKEPGPELLSLETQKFQLDFWKRHPDLELYFLQQSNGSSPDIVLRRMTAQEYARCLASTHTIKPRAYNSTDAQVNSELGFDATSPVEVLGLVLDTSSRTFTESQSQSGTRRILTQGYVTETEHVHIRASKEPITMEADDFMISREILILGGVPVEKTVRWDLVCENNYTSPAFLTKDTFYSWADGGACWTIDTSELRNFPYSNYEGFIAEFIRLRNLYRSTLERGGTSP